MDIYKLFSLARNNLLIGTNYKLSYKDFRIQTKIQSAAADKFLRSVGGRDREGESGFSVVRILEAVYHVGERTELPKVPNSSPIKLTSRLAKYLSRPVRQLHTLRGGDESLV